MPSTCMYSTLLHFTAQSCDLCSVGSSPFPGEQAYAVSTSFKGSECSRCCMASQV